MDKLYRILQDECAGHTLGAIVPGHKLALCHVGLTYLLAVGAIEFVSAPTQKQMTESVIKKLTPAARPVKPSRRKPPTMLEAAFCPPRPKPVEAPAEKAE